MGIQGLYGRPILNEAIPFLEHLQAEALEGIDSQAAQDGAGVPHVSKGETRRRNQGQKPVWMQQTV